MATTNKIPEFIAEQIADALKKVTAINAPKVYNLIQTNENKQTIVTMIIKQTIADFCTPEATILTIENRL